MASDKSPPPSPVAQPSSPVPSPATLGRLPPSSVVVQLTGALNPLFIGVSSGDLKKIMKRNKFSTTNISAATLKNAVEFVLKTKDARVLDKEGFDFESGLLVAKPYNPGQKEILWISSDEASSETDLEDKEEEAEDVNFLADRGVVSAATQEIPQTSNGTVPGTTGTLGTLIGLAVPDTQDGVTQPAMVSTLPPVHPQVNRPVAIPPALAGKYKINPLFSPTNARACDWLREGDDNFVEDELFEDEDDTILELAGWFSGGQFVSNYTLTSLQKVWGVNFQSNHSGSGWFIFKFENAEDRQKVLQSGPYVVNRRTLTLEVISNTFNFEPPPEHILPIWIKMYGLPYKLWKPRKIGALACRFGTPIEVDELTFGKNLLNFVRVLVKLDISKDLPSSYVFTSPSGDFKVRLEYENVPTLCKKCLKSGHEESSCPPEQVYNRSSYAAAAASRPGRGRRLSRDRPARQRQESLGVVAQGPSQLNQHANATTTYENPTDENPVQDDPSAQQPVQAPALSNALNLEEVNSEAHIEDVELPPPAQQPNVESAEQRQNGLPPRPPPFRPRSRSRSSSRVPGQRNRGVFMTQQGIPIPSQEDDGSGEFMRPRRQGPRKVFNAWRSFGTGESAGKGSAPYTGPS